MKKTGLKRDSTHVIQKVYYTIIETAIGWVGIAGNEEGLIRLILPEESPENIWEELSIYFHSTKKLIREEALFSDLTERIKNYFAGKRVEFSKDMVNISPFTPFQKKVLQKAREISYGKTKTYRWLAEESDFPRAYRAVGGVMKMNPLPLIIPCHRVIGSNGLLIGFSSRGGIELKRKMLTLEGILIGEK